MNEFPVLGVVFFHTAALEKLVVGDNVDLGLIGVHYGGGVYYNSLHSVFAIIGIDVSGLEVGAGLCGVTITEVPGNVGGILGRGGVKLYGKAEFSCTVLLGLEGEVGLGGTCNVNSDFLGRDIAVGVCGGEFNGITSACCVGVLRRGFL